MKSMTFQEFADNRDDATMRLVDVREFDEHRAVRAKGTELFPLSNLRRGQRFELDDREIYIICRSGSRSAFVASMLESEGVPECTNISDGTLGAIAAGPEYIERF